MNHRCVQLLICLVLVAPGCRYRDPSIDLLEAELRWTEDQLYLAEEEFRRQSAQLEACRLEAQAAASQRESDQAQTRVNGSRTRRVIEPDDDRLRTRPKQFNGATQTQRESDTPDVESDVPADALPRPRNGEIQTPEPLAPEPENSERLEIIIPEANIAPLDLNIQPSSFEQTLPPEGIQAIRIQCRLYGGIDFAGERGVEGLEVTLTQEPERELTKWSDGSVTVVVVDLEKKRHLARWDVDEGELTSLPTTSADGSRLTLKLGWPDGPPDAKHLVVYVRFTVPGERHFYAKQSLLAEFFGEIPATWTPAARPSDVGSQDLGPRDSATMERGDDAGSQVTVTRATAERNKPQRPVWRPHR
jgi:hypothetical protein